MLKEYVRPDDKMDKDTRKEEAKRLQDKLTAQQIKLKEANIPVIVLVEGWAAAGKGSLIKELISEIDPRFYNVESPSVIAESEERYPFLYQYYKIFSIYPILIPLKLLVNLFI